MLEHLQKNHCKTPQQECNHKRDTDPENGCYKLASILFSASVRATSSPMPRDALAICLLHFMLVDIEN